MSVVKVGMLLDAFSTDRPRLTATEVAKKTGIPLTTTHRLLGALCAIRMLEKDDVSGVYTVGRRAYALGNLYLTGQDLAAAASPVVQALNALTGESVNIGVLESDRLVLIMKEESQHQVRFATHVGSILPAHASSMGKALLADLSETELESRLPRELAPITARTTASWSMLRQELENTRMNGFAIDRQGVCIGVSCVGAVIRNGQGHAVAALSVAVPDVRVTEVLWNHLECIVPLAARLISVRLGHQDSASPVQTVDALKECWRLLAQEAVD